MPYKPLQWCAIPGCVNRVESGQCDEHRAETQRENDRKRGTPAERGYDLRWARISAAFLRTNPICIDCGEPSQVADHAPVRRAELVARGEEHPDAWVHLQPRCRPCDRRRHVREEGGFERWID